MISYNCDVRRLRPIVFAVVSIACGAACGPPASTNTPSNNRQAHFYLPSDGGALVSLPLTTARLTVVDAWSPTCEPCRHKLPLLVARSAELEAVGAKLVLVGVLSDSESTDLARTTLGTWGVERPFLVDRGNVVRRELDIDGLPGTVILSADGVIQWVAKPDARADDIVAAAKSL